MTDAERLRAERETALQCPSCYEGRRTRGQIEANDVKAAYDYLEAAKAEGYSQADGLIVAFSHNTGGICPHRPAHNFHNICIRNKRLAVF